MARIINKGERDRKRRLVYWGTIKQIAETVGTNKAQVDEIELVRWAQQNLDDIKASLHKHTERTKGVFEK